tara:strand:- start:121 stop:465 length:345 start_codon:yes stop_codon:yes gene_type:complete
MATNIAKRGVYIVAKANPGYNIVNYITKEVVIANIPYNKVANNINKTLNKSKEKMSVNNYQSHIDRYYKHFNDIQFYKHTIRTSKDLIKVFSAGCRLQDSIQMMNTAREYIRSF